MSERDPRKYVSLSPRERLILLSEVVYDLTEAYTDVGYLRSQELNQKHAVWTSDPSLSIQTRDRTASYAVAAITSELLLAEANLSALKEERQFLERLIDNA